MVNATTAAPTIGNVLLVANFPSDTAYAWWLMEEFWIMIGTFFQTHGGSVYLAYPQVRSLSERVQQSDLEVVTLTVPGGTTEERARADKFIQERRITTVYLTDRPWFSVDYAHLRRAGVRNILIHDHTPGDRPPITGLKRFFKTIRNRLPRVTADYIFCVSPLMRERDISNGCIPAERCLVVQNGIQPLTPLVDRTTIRASLGIPGDAFVVVTTGRAHSYKRFDFVIKTAAAVRQAQPELHVIFLLIGDGPAFGELQELVRGLNLQGTVHLLGYRSDAKNILFAADAAMHAALGEGFSLSIVEYMSAALPVLVPDIPSVKQAIRPGRDGAVYATVDDAAAIILNLSRDRSEARRIGQEARANASANFTLERSVQELEKHLQIILNQGTRA